MKRFTARSHWPTGHWIVPLLQFADKNGILPQDGQYVPQAVIDRLALFEDLGAEPYELQEALEFWHSKTVPLWQIPDQKRDEDFVSTTIELWRRGIMSDCDSGLPKLCFVYISPSLISMEAALFEVELFDIGTSSNDALWVIELKEPVNPHDYPDDYYFVEASLFGEVFTKEQFYFSNPSRLISKNTHTRRKENE